MRGLLMYTARVVIVMSLVIWQVPFSIPQDIAILTLTFMRWWGPPGSAVRFPVMAADSFSGDGRGAMPGQLAAELTIGFYIPWPFALAWII
jgi:hypothetical protein